MQSGHTDYKTRFTQISLSPFLNRGYPRLRNGLKRRGLKMSAPSKAYKFLLVKVQLGQRLAASPILNSTFREVTN